MKYLAKYSTKYDLRTIRKVRTCANTWDGSINPEDGWVYDHIFSANNGTVKSLGYHGRGFVNGSREIRNKPKTWEAAEQMWEFKLLFDKLCVKLQEFFSAKKQTCEFDLYKDTEINRLFLENSALLNIFDTSSASKIILEVDGNKIIMKKFT